MERDVRVEILRAILRSPHRDVAALAPAHRQALDGDPLFYLHLAAWYIGWGKMRGHGEVRDHKRLFIARLLTAPAELPEWRRNGRALFSHLSPREAERTARHAKELFGGAPRFLRATVERYLRALEANHRRFDGAAVRARTALKGLYALFHIRPSERAQAILFDRRPPRGSLPWVVKRLKGAEPPEAARLIAAHRVPFPIAVGAVRRLTPAVLVALLGNMTPQEVLNHLKLLERRGLLDDPEVKDLVRAKVEAAKGDRRVSTLKGIKARDALSAEHADLAAAVERAVDERVAAVAAITKPTAILVDVSSSMHEAIGVARELAAVAAPIAQGGLWVYVFNTTARRIKARGPARSDWERAFRLVRPNGATAIGAGLERMLRDGVAVEQIVLITDGGENTPPHFADAYRKYAEAMGGPEVVYVHVGYDAPRTFNRAMREVGAVRWDFTGDYYSIPNLLPILARPGLAELVDEVMATPLPVPVEV